MIEADILSVRKKLNNSTESSAMIRVDLRKLLALELVLLVASGLLNPERLEHEAVL